MDSSVSKLACPVFFSGSRWNCLNINDFFRCVHIFFGSCMWGWGLVLLVYHACFFSWMAITRLAWTCSRCCVKSNSFIKYPTKAAAELLSCAVTVPMHTRVPACPHRNAPLCAKDRCFWSNESISAISPYLIIRLKIMPVTNEDTTL